MKLFEVIVFLYLKKVTVSEDKITIQNALTFVLCFYLCPVERKSLFLPKTTELL